MKKILLLLIITLSLVGRSYSQIDLKSKTVLNNFILGYDTEESLKKKGIEIIDGVNSEMFGDIQKIRIDENFYQQQSNVVVLTLINNELFSVRYFPLKEKRIEKHFEILNKKYTTRYTRQEWYNENIQIDYDPNGEEESFVYYDIKILKKYPNYLGF
jgi:hypothetical protein